MLYLHISIHSSELSDIMQHPVCNFYGYSLSLRWWRDGGGACIQSEQVIAKMAGNVITREGLDGARHHHRALLIHPLHLLLVTPAQRESYGYSQSHTIELHSIQSPLSSA